MAMATGELLADMVDVIVRNVDPERIYLFGSYARGEANENSDVDLLIVQREKPGESLDTYREEVRLWELLAQFGVLKDILVCGSADFEYRRTGRNNVIARAVREGRVLYGRA